MIRYKNIKWTLLLAIPLLTALSGCQKFLDRKPLGSGIETDITQGGLEGEVYGLYSALRNDGMSGFNILVLKSIRSDDAEKGSSPGDQADITPVFNNFDYNKDYWLVNGYWDDHFNFITLATNIIHKIDSANLTDPASQTNRAEAALFRAYAYFDLVRDFGRVPKIDFPVYKPEDINVKKVDNIDEIYALIDSDLQFASANLPAEWEDRFVGRVTSGTANTLIAKTLLYRQNWAGALGKAEEVINSGRYQLVTPYHLVWREEGENSSESILEVQMYANASGNVVFGNNHNQVQGVRGSGEWDLGWGFNVPEQNLVDFYEGRNDPRGNATILYSGRPDDAQNGGYGRLVPDAPPLLQKYWNKKVYYDPARREAMSAPTGDAQFGRWLNIKLIRYADVLLMAAEAANELGGPDNTTKALNYLEMVRARARNGNAGVLPPITTTDQAALRQAIKDERRAEFGMEYERFYDLVRWGDAPAVLGPYGYEARNRYYPIPQASIDKSGGVLEQNEDY